MIRRPPKSTRTNTLFPYTTLFRSTDQRHGFLLGCAVEKVMGASSPRRRAPDEAAIAVLVGVERGGSTDDGVGRERAEIAAVETVADLPVHQEQLAVRDQTAARPNGQWSPKIGRAHV